MIEPVTVFQEGGPFMGPILATGWTNVLLGIAFASVAVRRRAPAALALFAAFLLLLLGTLGSQVGLGMVADGVGHASPEIRTTLMASGLSVASFTTIGALAMNVVLLGIAGLGASVAVFTRWSASPDEALSTRASATALLVAASGTLTWLGVIWSDAEAFRAVATASPESKQALLAAAIAWTQRSSALGVGATGLALIGGLVFVAPVATAASAKTIREGLASAVMVVALLALPLLVRPPSPDTLLAESIRQDEAPWAPVRDLGIALPTAEDCLRWSESARVSVGGPGVVVDGVWVGEAAGPLRDGMHWAAFERLDAVATGQIWHRAGFDVAGIVHADFDADAPWALARPVLAAAAGARFGTVRLGAARGDGICAVEVELLGAVHPTAGTRRPDPDPSDPDRFVELRIPPGDEPAEVVRLGVGDPVPDSATAVELAPADTATMQEIVDALVELSAFRRAILVADAAG